MGTTLTLAILEEACEKIRSLPPVVRSVKCSYADYTGIEKDFQGGDMFTPWLEPSAYIPRGMFVLEYSDGEIEVVHVRRG